MKKSDKSLKYVGEELHLFKNARNWKSYFSKEISSYILGDVLEVGAGIGANTPFLTKKSYQISSWSILEPDSGLISEIRTNANKLSVEPVFIINGTIDCLEEKTYDTIIYIDVLEHIEDSKLEIELAKQHLKTNGVLIILVPAYNFLYNDFDKSIGHYRRYSKKKLLREINDNFKTEKIFYLDSMGFFASLVNKFFLKKKLPSLDNIRFWDNYLVKLSLVFDILFLKRFGKSLIGIFRVNEQ